MLGAIALSVFAAVVTLEFGGRHATRGAASPLTHHPGRYARLFWTAAIGLAIVAIGIGAFSWQAAAAGAAVAVRGAI